MEITLNKKVISVSNPCSIQLLVNSRIGEEQRGIAVAVNGSVVPKASWLSTPLNNGDSVLIIKATQGG